MWRAALVVLFVALLLPLEGLAQLPEGLAGRWAGSVATEGAERPVHLAINARGDGFELDMALPDLPPLRVQLVETGTPRVFQVAAAPRGIFGFFEGAGRSDPFDGEPLVWARTTATSIVAYRLEIARDGGMNLVRLAIEPAEEGLHLRFERRIDVHPAERWQAWLEQEG